MKIQVFYGDRNLPVNNQMTVFFYKYDLNLSPLDYIRVSSAVYTRLSITVHRIWKIAGTGKGWLIRQSHPSLR